MPNANDGERTPSDPGTPIHLRETLIGWADDYRRRHPEDHDAIMLVLAWLIFTTWSQQTLRVNMPPALVEALSDVNGQLYRHLFGDYR